MIDDAIYTQLAGNGAVAAIVSTRIYLMKIAQGAVVPAITFQKVSSIPANTIDNTKSSLDASRYQVNSWDKSMRAAKALALAVRSALDGLNSTVAGSRIFGIVLLNELDFYEDDTGLHHVAQDFLIHHRVT